MGEWDVQKEEKFDEWTVLKEDPAIATLPQGAGMPIDTRTGQPVPTAAENMNMSKQAMGELMPIAGDIAGTALAPQLKLAASVPRIAKGGASILNLLMRSAGAAGGSAYGEAERQNFLGESDQNQIALQGLIGAGGEMTIGVAGAGLKAIQKPALETLADVTLSGGKLKQVLTQRLKNFSEKRSEQFLKSVAPDSIKGKIDEAGLNQAINETLDESKVLYSHFRDTLETAADKNSGIVPLPNTQAAIANWYKEIADPVLVKAGKIDRKAESEIIKTFGLKGSDDIHITIRKLARGETLSPKEVMHLQANIFPKKTSDYNALHPAKQESRQALKDVLMQDLDSIGVAAGKRSADEIFKETKRFQFIKNIFDRSMSVNKETGERKFLPWAFAENVARNEGMIRKAMPEIWPQIKAEAEYFYDVADRLKRGERNLGGPLMLGGLASSYFTGGIPVAEAFGAASAWALMSPTGQAALEGVFKYGLKSAAKGGLHIGGHLVEMEKSH